MFGVFEHKVTRPANPLVRGFDEVFYAPHSRHTGISREDVLNCRALRILAESDEARPVPHEHRKWPPDLCHRPPGVR